MPGLITDLLGKASIDTDHSVATTVTANRTAGVTELSAFDLSTYTEDTAVFFVTYTKTVDPLTSAVSITDVTSWKGLVNAGGNTITNLTVAPGYVDTGNTSGQFIECIPTSYWENSLIDMLLTEHKQLGGHKDITADSVTSTGAVEASEFITTGSGGDNGWKVGLALPTTIAYQGQRNYLFTYTGSDVTGLVSIGNRLRGARTLPAPTQAALFNGTNQYLNKATPNKMTFTDNFTLYATIKQSRTTITASNMYIMGRSDAGATTLWGLYIAPSGQWGLSAVNGGNNRFNATVAAIPYGREVKIRATWAAGVVNLYQDGVLMDKIQTTAGTPPTTVPQVGDFAIGRLGSVPTNTWYAGEISQAGVFDAVLSEATIKALDSQGLTGAEANIKSGYSLSNDITDLSTSTPNNLTNNNAVTFPTSGGFGDRGSSSLYEYGIIVTKPTYSGGDTTFYVQVPEGCMFPAVANLTTLWYSTDKAPFGFPVDKSRFNLILYHRGAKTMAIGAINQWTAASFGLRLPIGQWENLQFQGVWNLNSTVAGVRNGHIALADNLIVPITNNVYSNTPAKRIYHSASTTDALQDMQIDIPDLTFTTPTTFHVYGSILSATGSEYWILDTANGNAHLIARNPFV